MSQKYANVKIANKLNSSESSVENYLKKLYSKLVVTSKTEALKR
ncbi:LuxR C-terminal-related transcriptional regulator [Paenibacillus apis]